jgi:hypothetical protein
VKNYPQFLTQLDTNLARMSWGPGSKLMVYSKTAVDVTTLGAFRLGGHELEFTDKQVYLGLEFTSEQRPREFPASHGHGPRRNGPEEARRAIAMHGKHGHPPRPPAASPPQRVLPLAHVRLRGVGQRRQSRSRMVADETQTHR